MSEENNEFIIRDVIEKENADKIEKLTKDPNFPWYFCPGTVLSEDIEDNPRVIKSGSNPFQFTHTIDIDTSPYITVFAPVINVMAKQFGNNIEIARIKCNLLTRSIDHSYSLPHTDIDATDGWYSAIYYINDSDGDTHLFNEFGPKKCEEVTIRSRVSPEKNKLVVFNSNRFHASSSPINNDVRIIMNIVFRSYQSVE